jgi:tRNA(His) guanylyltransferase
MNKDSLGDRMKKMEEHFTSLELFPGLPYIARIDGRAFHTFTKGLERPYDKRLSDAMAATTKALVEEFDAICGYTQSDEISLVFKPSHGTSQFLFDGKVHKLTSILASAATAFFGKQLHAIPEKSHLTPLFDCRIFQVQNHVESVNYLTWRELDSTRNSVQMAARSLYSHAQVLDKNNAELQEMIFQKGTNWNDYPDFFKRGTYVIRKRIIRKFTAQELESLPPLHNARKNPDLVAERTILSIEHPCLGKDALARKYMHRTLINHGGDNEAWRDDSLL